MVPSLGLDSDVILIDDPISAKDAISDSHRDNANRFFDEMVNTRLNQPKIGLFIAIMQRTHADDFTANLMSKWRFGARWNHIVLPAEEGDNVKPRELRKHYRGGLLFPERFDRQVLDEMKATLGTAVYDTQYNQYGVVQSGAYIKAEWLQHRAALPNQAIWNMAIDPGYSEQGDPSGIVIFARSGEDMVIRFATGVNKSMPDLLRYIQSVGRLNGMTSQGAVLVEDKASGKSLVQLLKQQNYNAIEVKNRGRKKEDRAIIEQPLFESGRVKLVEGSWNREFTDNCVGFPTAKNDDILDATLYACEYFRERLAAGSRFFIITGDGTVGGTPREKQPFFASGDV